MKIIKFPKVFDPLYKGNSKKYKNIEDDQIYTVYAKCDEAEYNNLKHTPFLGEEERNLDSANCSVTFVTKTEIIERTGKLQLTGFDSRKYRKLSWKIKLDKKALGRKTLKFRANANDPTLMRDKLSSELYKAIGVPTYSSAYARVMINNDIYGLYNIVDTIGGKWLASTIHGDDDARTGYSYKTFDGADLKYRGENIINYTDGTYEVDELDPLDTEANGNDWYRLIHFTKLFYDWQIQYANDQSQAAVTALEKFFNLESVLRQMVIESLTYAFDNFWANSSNFALYYVPEKDGYYIIPYDFDGTFYGSTGSSRFNASYLTDVNDCIHWADNARVDKDTYFISRLFKHTIIKNRYDQIMKKTVDELFNVNSMSPLIDSIYTLIDDEISWNFNLIDKLDHSIPGFVNHFTYQNFKDNTNYKSVGYYPSINYNDAHFGLKQWIKVRSNLCKQYTNQFNIDANTVVSTTTTTTTTTKPVVKTTTTTTTTTKPVVKTTTTKPVTKKTTTKPVVKTTTTKPVTKKTTTIKPVTKKATTTKPVTKKATTTKPVTKKATTTKPVTKKTITKPVTKKATTTKPVTKKVTVKSVIKTTNKLVVKTTVKPVTKKTTTTKPVVQTPVINTNIPVSSVKYRCGPQYGHCAQSNECCSKYGWCGTSDGYCGAGCQSEFGQCSGTVANTTTVAKTTTTTSKIAATTGTTIPISTVKYRCGPQYGRCAQSNECCSKYGWCGTSADYCQVGCQSGYGLCL